MVKFVPPGVCIKKEEDGVGVCIKIEVDVRAPRKRRALWKTAKKEEDGSSENTGGIKRKADEAIGSTGGLITHLQMVLKKGVSCPRCTSWIAHDTYDADDIYTSASGCRWHMDCWLADVQQQKSFYCPRADLMSVIEQL